MRSLIAILFVSAIANLGISQHEIRWELLEVNKLAEVKDSVRGITYDMPVFTEDQLKLSGKKIVVSGYMYMVDSEDILLPTLFLLQRYKQTDYGEDYPLDAIIEIQFKKEPVSVNSVKKTKVKGVLELNKDDYMHPFYVLTNAKFK